MFLMQPNATSVPDFVQLGLKSAHSDSNWIELKRADFHVKKIEKARKISRNASVVTGENHSLLICYSPRLIQNLHFHLHPISNFTPIWVWSDFLRLFNKSTASPKVSLKLFVFVCQLMIPQSASPLLLVNGPITIQACTQFWEPQFQWKCQGF